MASTTLKHTNLGNPRIGTSSSVPPLNGVSFFGGTDMERFMDKVIIGPGGCWLWTAAVDRQGYGVFWADGKTHLAHRWAYSQLVGGNMGMESHHTCKEPSCVNPHHLKVMSRERHQEEDKNYTHHKTHCKNGHLLSGDNVHLYAPPGKGERRICKTCRGVWNRQRVMKGGKYHGMSKM
jgi:hypothetical protein